MLVSRNLKYYFIRYLVVIQIFIQSSCLITSTINQSWLCSFVLTFCHLDDWEIPFEMISDLQWLGSGAQGAVFSGKLKNEVVAVKKVREQKETDIRHLRKLNHPNIVQFRYAYKTLFYIINQF